PADRADRPRGRGRAREVRGPDALAHQDSDHPAARAVVRLPRRPAHADLPSRLPPAKPRGKTARVGGHPAGDAGARHGAAEAMKRFRLAVAGAAAWAAGQATWGDRPPCVAPAT